MLQGQSVHSEGIMGPAGDLQKGAQVQSAVTRENPFEEKKSNSETYGLFCRSTHVLLPPTVHLPPLPPPPPPH